MYGGPKEAADAIAPIMQALAHEDRGWAHVGPVGSGHFTKMIHNGIEYGMMQAFAEGLDLLKGKEEFNLDLAQITELWRHGSVVRSWLLDLTAEALAHDQELSAIAPYVADSGEGRWTVVEAVDQGVAAPGLTLAVPLVCLGSIYNLAGQELTPLFGQPDWFLGILTCQAGNLKVLDTARWVMPDRYRDDFRQGLNYVISVQGYEWGLAVHQVSRSLRLDPSEIKWRSQRGQRPWLAGTVIEHMCALLDVAALAELIASGAVKQMHARQK